MKFHRPSFVPFVLTTLAGSPAVAQDAPRAFLEGPTVQPTAVGIGTGYRLELEAGRAVFHPFPDAPTASDETTLGLEFHSVTRGSATTALEARAPETRGLELRASRGSGVTEHWELRDLETELSFVFDTPLPGSGDLVVRGRIDTGLQVSAATESYIELLDPHLGGVRIGAVLGIDANGRMAAGALRLEGDVLELSLPAEFVDSATYPLVLDPPIAPFAFAIDPNGTITDPDAARASWLHQNFIVAYEREIVGQPQIIGRIFNSVGALVGGELLVEVGLFSTPHSPRVACVEDRFLVVWHSDSAFSDTGQIRARSYNTDGSAPSAAVTLLTAPEADLTGDHDVSGRQYLGSSDETALLAWREADGGLKTMRVTLVGQAPPAVVDGSIVELTQPPFLSTDGRPRLTATSGENGQLWAATWVRTTTSFVEGSTAVLAQLIGADGTPAGPVATVATGGEQELSDPVIDGDGESYVVAWEHHSDGLFQTHTVRARALTGANGTLTPNGPPVTLAGSLFDNATAPRVAHGPGRSMVTYLRGGAVNAVGISSQSAEIYEAEFAISLGLAAAGHALAAGRVPGHESSDHAASVSIVPSKPDPVLAGSMLEFVGASGFQTNLGGACGNGGWVAIPDDELAVGNPSLPINLVDADPGALAAFLNLNVGMPLPITCGPCAITPILELIPVPVSAGSASIELPIPCAPALIDAYVEWQWITVTPATTGCDLVPGISFSNRQRMQIGS